ncbi:hypothetical protein KSP40_PGU011146 [Platanthera guangdongensis]|uniref:Uncharacterized protein n=1 Tax=Platanthera guangdongensis TaxID=2320717 RepID=A0ABR2M459_9ASPA
MEDGFYSEQRKRSFDLKKCALSVALAFGLVTGEQKLKKLEEKKKLTNIYKQPREYLGLTDAKLCGKDMVALGLATHFVESEVLFDDII